MQFTFTATTEDGKAQTGVREAADRFALARELRRSGLTPITIVQASQVNTKKPWWQFDFGVSLRDKVLFASNLGAMLEAGLSLARALAVIERQTEHVAFKAIIVSIQDQVQAGTSLSQALASFGDVFPPVFVAMVGAGEESGNLPKSLGVISSQLGKSYELRRKIRGALIYPAIIVVAIIIIGILMMMFLIPTLTKTFTDLKVELPLSTRILIGISDLLVNHTVAVVGGLVGLIILVVYGSRTKTGQHWFDYLLLRLPLCAKLTREFNAAVVMRTISSLIGSGVGMVESLRLTSTIVQNSYFRTIFETAGDKIQKGTALSAIIREHDDLFLPLVAEMIEVGEETGNLPAMLARGASFFEEEVDQATKNLSTIIEPLLMIIIGTAVGFFAVSVIGPIYSLTAAL